MNPVHTWSGRFCGWIDADGLFNQEGRHVGQIYRGIVYNENGNYIGELMEERLITNILRKDTHRWYGFFANPEPSKGSDDQITTEPAKPMPDGYEDFPDLATARS
jgi:hypothetical protein